MIYKRIIPNLLFHDGEFYTSVKFKKRIYLGEAINILQILNDKQIDELIITPVNYDTINFLRDLNKITKFIFVPLTINGQIKTISEAASCYSLGVEKISFHSGIFEEFPEYEKISNKYGVQAVSLSLVAKKSIFGNRFYNNSQGKFLSKNQVKYLNNNLKRQQHSEVILFDKDSDGSFNGFTKLDLLDEIRGNRIIIGGGIGSNDEIHHLLSHYCDVKGVCVASKICFASKNSGVLINYPSRDKIMRRFPS